jgi:hypothetical protein
MSAKYFIAVCDILGFSSLVYNSDPETIVNQQLRWLRQVLQHSVYKSTFPQHVPSILDLERHAKIGVALFSDTILFFTKEDTNEAIRELLATIGWLIFETIIHGQTKIRGGIAYGEAVIDVRNSLFVGRPIIDAHKLEQSQQWAGAALHESAIDRLPKDVRAGGYADWWIIRHDVPVKKEWGGENTFATLAINWNLGIHNPDWRFRWSNSSDMPLIADWEKNRDICEKFVNTKVFHELHCRTCKT